MTSRIFPKRCFFFAHPSVELMNLDFGTKLEPRDKIGTVVFRLHFVFRRLLLADYDWYGQCEEDLTFGRPK